MLLAVASLIVRCAARLVPRDLRARWVEEWLGELHAAGRSRSSRSMFQRARGAPIDAAILRLRHWAALDAWRGGWGTDVRDAVRALRRAPLQAAVIVVCLTLATALAVLMFGVYNAVVAGELPGIRERSRLVLIRPEGRNGPSSLTMGQFGVIPAAIPALKSIGAELAWHNLPVSINGRGTSAVVRFVTGPYFDTLGTQATLGRLLQHGDDRADGSGVVVLGHGFWERHFAGRTDVVGEFLRVGPATYRIVGVTPPGFGGVYLGDFGKPPEQVVDLWLPMAEASRIPFLVSAIQIYAAVGPKVVARLADDVSLDEAKRLIQPLAGRFDEAAGGHGRIRAISLEPFTYLEADPFAGALLFVVLMAVPVLVLGVACANVAGIQLARAVQRTHELAVRVSLGGSRYRVTRLLTIETLLLTVTAGVIAWFAAGQLLRIARNVLPFVVVPDTGVLLFTTGVLVAVALLAGLMPAWRATGFDVTRGLRLGPAVGRSAGPSLRRAVVSGQIALSVVLLLTAIVLVRSLDRLPSTIGDLRDDILAVDVRLDNLQMSDADQRTARRTILERLGALPGVQAVAVSEAPLLAVGGATTLCWSDVDRTEASPWLGSSIRRVSANYFSTLDVAVLQGRVFADTEPDVVVINRRMAAEIAGSAAVGALIRIGEPQFGTPGGGSDAPPSRLVRVVGLAEDSYERSQGEPRPRCYMPVPADDAGGFSALVRSAQARSLAPAVSGILSGVDPRLGAHWSGTVGDLIRERFRWASWFADALGWVALATLGLAAVGLFGVMSYSGTQRAHEFGVRLALGALPRDLVAAIVRESLRIVAWGAGAGSVLYALTVFALGSGPVPGVSHADPLPAVLAIAILTATGLGAALVPIRRVSTMDPVRALRSD